VIAGDGKHRRTFRWRLTATMIALAIVILAAASTATYVGVRTALLWNLDSTLLSLARTEIASALDEPGSTIHVHEEIPLRKGVKGVGGLGFEKVALIRDQQGRLRAQTANLEVGAALDIDPESEARALRGEVAFASVMRGDHRYRAIYHPLRDTAGAPLVAVVAVPMRPVTHLLDLLLGALTISLLLGGGAAAIVANGMARRLTWPLQEISGAARRIGATNLQGRIPDVSPDVELHDLTQVLNEMLARLEAAFVGQRRFLADASHELRSPVSNLRGTVEVALRHPRSTAEYQETLRITLAEAERLSRLVNELLMLSRVDANELTLELAPCDLSEIAAAATTALKARSLERGVHLRLDSQGAPLIGDVHRLREVVDNLLDNAVRHAPEGSEVCVRTYRTANDGVVLSVQDSGPGLSREDQARIFDRFYRVDGSRARDSGGLGLGLAIAKAIVEAHGGKLTVQSEPGKGCCFSACLPVSRQGD
jgi:heavy metal sensor kinase